MTDTKIYFILIIFSFAFLISCEDQIDVELDPAEQLVVVDAWLNDIPSEIPKIKLSLSQSYFDSLSVDELNNAIVSVRSGSGQTYDFKNLDNSGTYILTNPVPWFLEDDGTTFDLDISLGGNSYTASATKFPVPPIDSIQQEFREDAFVDEGIFCNFFATDLPGLGNTYWIKTFKNDTLLNRPAELNIAYDSAFSAGSEVDNLVFIQPIQELNNPVDENFSPIPWQAGETIRVEIHSISNSAFFYLEVLRDQLLNSSNGIFATPLANTRGNISSSDGKTVLGYFNVASVSSLEEVIE